jgi:hypothetical protein
MFLKFIRCRFNKKTFEFIAYRHNKKEKWANWKKKKKKKTAWLSGIHMKKCTFIRIFSIYFSFGSFDFSIWCFGLKLIFVHVSIPKFKNSEKKSLENEREKRKLLLNHILITKKSILI